MGNIKEAIRLANLLAQEVKDLPLENNLICDIKDIAGELAGIEKE